MKRQAINRSNHTWGLLNTKFYRLFLSCLLLCETIQKHITSSLKENERGKKRNTEEMHFRGSEGRVGSKMKIQYGQNGHGKEGAASIQCGLQSPVCVTLNRTALAHQVWEPLS